MEDIFVRCSTIADSLTKAGYKQVMQVLTDVFYKQWCSCLLGKWK